MPRTARAAVGGVVYHLLNRGNGRMEIFREPEDHQAFIGNGDIHHCWTETVGNGGWETVDVTVFGTDPT